MATYNTINVRRLIPCPTCGDSGKIRLQFAFGDTWQYGYAVGDSIRWGGNDYGKPADDIDVIAYPDRCMVCGLDTPGHYVLRVIDGVISAYRMANVEEVASLEADNQRGSG